MKFRSLAVAAATFLVGSCCLFGSFHLFGSALGSQRTAKGDQPPKRIAWYATLESGLAEAKRSNRPILFTSAAPQCLGVPGIW